ncbi:MAG: Transcription-repair-coupling factor [Sodalis sp.]|nr:MAG: Transcription-repair-coupling factor [Sodalis sp.]
MRTDVDILTLTATPIPRTLNMAMSGMRDRKRLYTNTTAGSTRGHPERSAARQPNLSSLQRRRKY